MKPLNWKKLGIGEAAAAVCSYLQGRGIEASLVGGACVSIYSFTFYIKQSKHSGGIHDGFDPFRQKTGDLTFRFEAGPATEGSDFTEAYATAGVFELGADGVASFDHAMKRLPVKWIEP
jgi:hypothetical protein